MGEHINLIAYQDHETESNFPDDKSVVDYYKEKMNTCNVLIDFIKSNFVKITFYAKIYIHLNCALQLLGC